MVVAIAVLMFLSAKRQCPLLGAFFTKDTAVVKEEKKERYLSQALDLLKHRKDKEAYAIFDSILARQPDNLYALWGEAEVLRRSRQYQKSEDLLGKILDKDPNHASSLISLAYIRYKDDKLKEALRLVNQALDFIDLDKENQALCYMMLGAVNSRLSERGVFLNKVIYGTRIKSYFLRAKELSPGLPEVHLGLGTYYLLAPVVSGGNLGRAIGELELAVKIAPDFATANARLAQAYKKKGNLEKYNFYIGRVEKLDPDNEVLKGISE